MLIRILLEIAVVSVPGTPNVLGRLRRGPAALVHTATTATRSVRIAVNVNIINTKNKTATHNQYSGMTKLKEDEYPKRVSSCPTRSWAKYDASLNAPRQLLQQQKKKKTTTTTITNDNPKLTEGATPDCSPPKSGAS